jgi:hypothetical protein
MDGLADPLVAEENSSIQAEVDQNGPGRPGKPEIPDGDKKLVAKLQARIKADRKHHDKAFKRMKRSMYIAAHGCDKAWPKRASRTNITGSHIRKKTASLYAKNPKVAAKRRETMDFAVWDENPQSLLMAMQIVQQGMLMMQAAALQPPAMPGMASDPLLGGMAGGAVPGMQPALPPGYAEALALVEDFQQGMQRRQLITKLGKTMEILFTHQMTEQTPLDFKTGMKRVVRRALTCCVGYVEVCFQREYGPLPYATAQLADFRERIDHLRGMAENVADPDTDLYGASLEAEVRELELAVEALQSQPEVITREGLVFDYPASTAVIPDRNCKSLIGFVGAEHMTIQYMYSRDKVREVFGVDVGSNYTGYALDGKLSDSSAMSNEVPEDCDSDDEDDTYSVVTDKWGREPADKGLVCVLKHYDRPAGLVYYIAEGYPGFLRPPAAPDVLVEDFWPLYAVTFNDVEDEDELFPESDVEALWSAQNQWNISRQGMSEHRQAARPRFAATKGALEGADIGVISGLKPFEVAEIAKDPQTKLADVLEVFPVPGVDPNLYETNQLLTDTQLTVGVQEAQLGGTSQATATESAIAAGSTATTDGSNKDDLDGFLTRITRASSQILLQEMSPEKVMEIAGIGAVWPEMNATQIASEIFLEVAAGSTGKPNQAVEIDNITKLAPFLIQTPGLQPQWLLKQFLSRMDDRLDLTEAFAEGMPSIMAMNAMKPQPQGGAPAEGQGQQSDPNAQGPQGGQNAPAAPRDSQGGSDPAFGSNQV